MRQRFPSRSNRYFQQHSTACWRRGDEREGGEAAEGRHRGNIDREGGEAAEHDDEKDAGARDAKATYVKAERPEATVHDDGDGPVGYKVSPVVREEKVGPVCHKLSPVDREDGQVQSHRVTIRTARARMAKMSSMTSSKFPGGMSRRAATR